MNPTWIIDTQAIKNTSYEDLPEIIQSMGYGVVTVDYNSLITKDHKFDSPSIFYGTINSARKMNGEIGGLYFDEENYKYHVYYSNLEVHQFEFLNGCFMTPFANLTTMLYFYSKIGIDKKCDKFFIRPDSAVKLFTGMVLDFSDIDDYNNQIWYIANKINPETLIVVSHEQEILEEYRTIICGNEVIASSRYMLNGEPHEDSEVPQRAIELANDVAGSEWKPDDIFVCDIAKIKGDKFRIIELNAFSTAGWYACDVRAIVDKVSKYFLTTRIRQECW